MALLCFLLALMSKAMVVTLPCLMLLLDYWPLRRFDPASLNRGPAALRRIGPLLVEKLPFFALAAGFTVIASLMLKQANAIEIGEPVSLSYRVGNAIVACAYYVQKMFWPAGLAVFYPRPATWPTGALALGSVLLLGMTAISAVWFRRRPYFVVGWLWFAVTLAPVSGLVQLGEHAFADRYTYLPLIGLFIILVWGAVEVASSLHIPYRALAAATVLILICLGLATRQQLRYWRNSRALLEHALVVGGDSTAMHNDLGSAVAADGDWAGAEAHFRTVLRLRPALELTRLNLALALARQHKSTDALQELAQLGPALLPQAHEELGRAFAETGQTAEARAQFQELIKLKPDAESHYHLALSLLILGEAGEAAGHYREAIRLKPDWQEPLNDLAWLLATQPNARLRDGPAAVVLAEHACVLSGRKEARFLGTLDAAYAEAGRFPEAIATAEEARSVALAAGQKAVAELAVKRLDLYRAGKPFRQPDAP
jgi:Flp pilus assembly protein TadD